VGALKKGLISRYSPRQPRQSALQQPEFVRFLYKGSVRRVAIKVSCLQNFMSQIRHNPRGYCIEREEIRDGVIGFDDIMVKWWRNSPLQHMSTQPAHADDLLRPLRPPFPPFRVHSSNRGGTSCARSGVMSKRSMYLLYSSVPLKHLFLPSP
jgi:hypothetical protein